MASKAFFLIRLNDHIQYLKKINRTLEGQDNFQGCVHTECKLGKWMYSEGLAEVAALNNPHALQLFESIKKPHEQFHRISQDALAKHFAHDPTGAAQAVTEMHKLSATICNKLLELDKIA